MSTTAPSVSTKGDSPSLRSVREVHQMRNREQLRQAQESSKEVSRELSEREQSRDSTLHHQPPPLPLHLPHIAGGSGHNDLQHFMGVNQQDARNQLLQRYHAIRNEVDKKDYSELSHAELVASLEQIFESVDAYEKSTADALDKWEEQKKKQSTLMAHQHGQPQQGFEYGGSFNSGRQSLMSANQYYPVQHPSGVSSQVTSVSTQQRHGSAGGPDSGRSGEAGRRDSTYLDSVGGSGSCFDGEASNGRRASCSSEGQHGLIAASPAAGRNGESSASPLGSSHSPSLSTGGHGCVQSIMKASTTYNSLAVDGGDDTTSSTSKSFSPQHNPPQGGTHHKKRVSLVDVVDHHDHHQCHHCGQPVPPQSNTTQQHFSRARRESQERDPSPHKLGEVTKFLEPDGHPDPPTAASPSLSKSAQSLSVVGSGSATVAGGDRSVTAIASAGITPLQSNAASPFSGGLVVPTMRFPHPNQQGLDKGDIDALSHSFGSSSLCYKKTLHLGVDAAGFSTLNGYTVLNDELGDGATGTVILVSDALTSQLFAIKKIKRMTQKGLQAAPAGHRDSQSLSETTTGQSPSVMMSDIPSQLGAIDGHSDGPSPPAFFSNPISPVMPFPNFGGHQGSNGASPRQHNSTSSPSGVSHHLHHHHHHPAAQQLDVLSRIGSVASGVFSNQGTVNAAPPVVGSTTYDFHKEVAIMKKLKHPNLVKLHEVIDDQTDDHVFLVMDYVEGGKIISIDYTSNTCTDPVDVIPEHIVRGQFKCISHALRYLHRNKIAHLDIKPDNILLNDNGDPVIIDFGVSHHDITAGATPSKFGTPCFFSPEQCEGVAATEMDLFAADIWALGVTLYAMLFRKLPFHAPSYPKLRRSICEDYLVLPKDCSNEARNLLTAMLCKDPKHRINIKDICQHPFVKAASKKHAKQASCYSSPLVSRRASLAGKVVSRNGTLVLQRRPSAGGSLQGTMMVSEGTTVSCDVSATGHFFNGGGVLPNTIEVPTHHQPSASRATTEGASSRGKSLGSPTSVATEKPSAFESSNSGNIEDSEQQQQPSIIASPTALSAKLQQEPPISLQVETANAPNFHYSPGISGVTLATSLSPSHSAIPSPVGSTRQQYLQQEQQLQLMLSKMAANAKKQEEEDLDDGTECDSTSSDDDDDTNDTSSVMVGNDQNDDSEKSLDAKNDSFRPEKGGGSESQNGGEQAHLGETTNSTSRSHQHPHHQRHHPSGFSTITDKEIAAAVVYSPAATLRMRRSSSGSKPPPQTM